jgi:hypothetical protein
MKIKTNTLAANKLDWAVAKCEELDVYIPAFADNPWLQLRLPDGGAIMCPNFGENWTHGGLIIEREGINLTFTNKGDVVADNAATIVRGPTVLIAAMRCYVASKLGDEVDIPEELCEQISNL